VKTPSEEIDVLRKQIDEVNAQLLRLLSQRAELVLRVAELKRQTGLPMYDPVREAEELAEVLPRNSGPFSDATIKHLFNEFFRASLDLQRGVRDRTLRVTRAFHETDTVFTVGEVTIGAKPLVIAGPCAVESAEQIEEAAAQLARRGVRILRGGAHKPRTSPYSFQGIGDAGYRLLAEAAHRHGMICVSEVLDEAGVAAAAECVDMLQVGARNMANFRLLEVVREAHKPVLLKRGPAATYEELLLAAEYLIIGTEQIMVCERGIRTFENWTRNTLDISAVPLLRAMSHLPVAVDVSHAAGRPDILAPLARAALAAGANAIMIEVHPTPALALSDPEQQIDFAQFDKFLSAIAEFLT